MKKKKSVKKLVITKTVIANLQSQDLKYIIGGSAEVCETVVTECTNTHLSCNCETPFTLGFECATEYC